MARMFRRTESPDWLAVLRSFMRDSYWGRMGTRLAEARVERRVKGIPMRRTREVLRTMVSDQGRAVETLTASRRDWIQPTGVNEEARPSDLSVPNSSGVEE